MAKNKEIVEFVVRWKIEYETKKARKNIMDQIRRDQPYDVFGVGLDGWYSAKRLNARPFKADKPPSPPTTPDS